MSYSGGRISKEVHRQWDPPEDPRKYGAKCDICPLKGQEPVWGDGPRDPKYAFIGEAPGRDEIQLGIPFVGGSGSLLVKWIDKVFRLARTEVWIDNAIACFPPGGDMKAFLQRSRKEHKAQNKEFHHPVDCCRSRLFRSMRVPFCANCKKYLRGPDSEVCRCPSPKTTKWKDGSCPEHTLMMGNFAMLAVAGVEGITERHGYPIMMDEKRNALAGTSAVHAAEVLAKKKERQEEYKKRERAKKRTQK